MPVCGALTRAGKPCQRRVRQGRCYQHRSAFDGNHRGSVVRDIPREFTDRMRRNMKSCGVNPSSVRFTDVNQRNLVNNPMISVFQCIGITTRGHRCSRTVHTEGSACYQHKAAEQRRNGAMHLQQRSLGPTEQRTVSEVQIGHNVVRTTIHTEVVPRSNQRRTRPQRRPLNVVGTAPDSDPPKPTVVAPSLIIPPPLAGVSEVSSSSNSMNNNSERISNDRQPSYESGMGRSLSDESAMSAVECANAKWAVQPPLVAVVSEEKTAAEEGGRAMDEQINSQSPASIPGDQINGSSGMEGSHIRVEPMPVFDQVSDSNQQIQDSPLKTSEKPINGNLKSVVSRKRRRTELSDGSHGEKTMAVDYERFSPHTATMAELWEILSVVNDKMNGLRNDHECCIHILNKQRAVNGPPDWSEEIAAKITPERRSEVERKLQGILVTLAKVYHEAEKLDAGIVDDLFSS